MNTTQHIALQLHSTVLEFINDFLTVFPRNTPHGKRLNGDLAIMKLFFTHMDPDKLIIHIVKEVLPHAERIKLRDEAFFLENKAIFANLAPDRVHEISSSWKNGFIDAENKAIIWAYFDTIIALCAQWKRLHHHD